MVLVGTLLMLEWGIQGQLMSIFTVIMMIVEKPTMIPQGHANFAKKDVLNVIPSQNA